MSTVAEVEKLAFSLSEKERAKLAGKLLGSLRPILDDEDEGLAEAIRRDREMNENPQMGITLDQLDELIADGFRQNKNKK